MNESTLNRVLFRSNNAWVQQNKTPPEEQRLGDRRSIAGQPASSETLREWAGFYYCEVLNQTWEVVFSDGGLWLVPPGEAAQLLSPNGPDGMRCRGVNLWFVHDEFVLTAVDEITADSIDNVWFKKVRH